MTLYRIYTENGNRAGFWVQHRSWNNICARIQSIGGQESGKLPGAAPLHDHAAIQIECFDVRSGRPSAADGFAEQLVTDPKFVTIAQPSWY
ncbi:MAG TPA: hypothetical protein VHS31_04160 [Tepidisphaeraceae bacterium]|jgi:hypothetical protein|nr:hypothetical protein [Tepidisphaeraceae bacterium]